MKHHRIWLTWENQRRNRSMSREVDAELNELTTSRRGVLRYLLLSLRTVACIVKTRPAIVFAQNPSVILSTIVVALARLASYRVVVDAHNSALFPDYESTIFQRLSEWSIRHADLTIVTNSNLAMHVSKLGGTPVVMPDPLPTFPDTAPLGDTGNGGNLMLICICSWAPDEPYTEMLQAARAVTDQPLQIRVTGNPKGKVIEDDLPPNVVLTGFVSEAAYQRLLSSADGVIVLTKREDCLNCGAYEAVALEKPGLLSDTTALKQYFTKGFEFAEPSASSIESALRRFVLNQKQLSNDVSVLRHEISSNYSSYVANLETALAH